MGRNEDSPTSANEESRNKEKSSKTCANSSENSTRRAKESNSPPKDSKNRNEDSPTSANEESRNKERYDEKKKKPLKKSLLALTLRIISWVCDKLQHMIPIVFGKLKDSGFFYDPVARDIESNFIPSLIKNVQVKGDEAELARVVMDELLRKVVQERMEAYSKKE